MSLRALAIRAALAGSVLLGTPAHATLPPRSGPLAPELSAAFSRGLFEVPAVAPGLAVSATPREWRIPVIRVAFSDSALVHPGVALEQRLFDTTGVVPTGSMAEYYRWASAGRLLIRGEVVATVTLPNDRFYYTYDAWGLNTIGSPNNAYGMFRDALKGCDARVDFSRFDLDADGYVDMLWLVHAGPGGETSTSRRDLWSITSRATAGWNNASAFDCDDLVPGSLNQRMRVDRFTVLPELSGFKPGQLCEIGVFCHEFGHTLGLPDLYDTSSLGGAANVGPGNWSLMSTGAYGADGLSPESPAHLGAWPLLWLDWVTRVRPREDTTLVLRPIVDGGEVIEVTFEGEDNPEHLLLENRVRDVFDRRLPAEGLLLQQVDEAVIGSRISANRVNTGPTPGLRIIEADGDGDLISGANRGDPNDPFPGQLNRVRIDDTTTPSTRTFAGAPTNVALQSIARTGRDVSVRVQVRAPGWDTPRALQEESGEPLQSAGPATRSAIAPSGRAWQVSAEIVAGRTAIVLRERPWLQSWRVTDFVDEGHGGVSEPTLAWLGGDDLAVVWVDAASGVGQLMYRARLQGRWTAARVLTRSNEGCFAPALAADARGRMHLAWIETVAPRTRLQYMNFLYAAPYGQVRTLTSDTDLPTPPGVTAAGNGRAYVVWPDLSTGTHRIFAARFHPDSGLSVPFRLTPNNIAAQPTVSSVVDTSGVLHSVWQVSSGGGSEIHYQRRQPRGAPSQRDTTIDAIGSSLQNPRLALDPAGTLHVTYERASATGLEVRYKRWRPGIGWDARATRISESDDVTASVAEPLPTSGGNVTVVWTGFDGTRARLRTRERRLDGNGVTAVEPEVRPRAIAMRLGPDPLRPGEVLELWGDAVRVGDAISLYDLAGRTVATTRASQAGRARFAAANTRGLAPGLYFVRVHDREGTARVVVLH